VITAVDTNVLLDVLIPGAQHLQESRMALAQAWRAGGLIISEPVYAELSVRFSDGETLDHFLDRTGLRFAASPREALFAAGEAWRTYLLRRRGIACPGAESLKLVCDRWGDATHNTL
jgi:predicted nucleic acid-binding protein